MLPPPVLSSSAFPCEPCHGPAGPSAGGRSTPSPHALVRIEGHMEKEYGCGNCHDPADPASLRLFSGKVLAIGNSTELCRQCHPARYRRWQAGLHGRHRGRWDGAREQFPCTTCHDPHRPRFRPLPPEPPPRPPEETLRWRP